MAAMAKNVCFIINLNKVELQFRGMESTLSNSVDAVKVLEGFLRWRTISQIGKKGVIFILNFEN
jgi:hypothetical protein